MILLAAGVHAQNASQELFSINAQIDEAVVKKNTNALEKYYVRDLVFTNGTGLAEGNKSWIKNESNTKTHFVTRH